MLMRLISEVWSNDFCLWKISKSRGLSKKKVVLFCFIFLYLTILFLLLIELECGVLSV